jgi:hypothetical protein
MAHYRPACLSKINNARGRYACFFLLRILLVGACFLYCSISARSDGTQAPLRNPSQVIMAVVTCHCLLYKSSYAMPTYASSCKDKHTNTKSKEQPTPNAQKSRVSRHGHVPLVWHYGCPCVKQVFPP